MCPVLSEWVSTRHASGSSSAWGLGGQKSQRARTLPFTPSRPMFVTRSNIPHLAPFRTLRTRSRRWLATPRVDLPYPSAPTPPSTWMPPSTRNPIRSTRRSRPRHARHRIRLARDVVTVTRGLGDPTVTHTPASARVADTGRGREEKKSRTSTKWPLFRLTGMTLRAFENATDRTQVPKTTRATATRRRPGASKKARTTRRRPC